MRTRLLLAGIGLAIVTLLGLGAPASAAPADPGGGGEEPVGGEGEAEITVAAEECIELLEGGADIDACQEAPSPILPPVNELVWGSISFAIVVGLLWKLAWPGIKKGMEGRTERIRTDLEAAENAKAEADKVLADYHAQLADARNESARILEEARQDADAVRSERIAAIDGEIAEMRRRAAAEIESSKAQAVADLRGEITALALGAAERVVERNLDDETNRALIDSYIDSVGSRG